MRAHPVHVDAAAVERLPELILEPLPEEQPLPVDLDQPLAAYDPAAVPDEPLDWFPPPTEIEAAPRRQTFDPGERFETFALTPMVRPAPPSAAEPPSPLRAKADPSETIQALLDRLERVAAARRDAVPAPPPAELVAEPPVESIEDTLTALRRMAMR